MRQPSLKTCATKYLFYCMAYLRETRIDVCSLMAGCARLTGLRVLGYSGHRIKGGCRTA
jgi:hypothetical protein